MQNRADYDRALSIVRRVIHEWDPYDLIRGCGCPKDEWDGEIAKIVAEIPRIRSIDDATDVLSRIFSHAFQPEGFEPSACANVGSKLYSELVAADLLAPKP
jgi:hypothetical protein